VNDNVNEMWSARIRNELVGNILPFWTNRAVDRNNGGFYGKIDWDLAVVRKEPRSAVLNTRILWTFAAASRLLGADYLDVTNRAFDYIMNKFRDPEHDGLFWMLDYQGKVISSRKQIYAQAFGIYAFSEYYRATGNQASLEFAQRLFQLIEKHSRSAAFGGYLEACRRDWTTLDDMRLSEKDINCPKSMNTHLHIMEAYTNLLRVWRDPVLVTKQTELLRISMDRIVNPKTGHLKLFFDERWNQLSEDVSFGHDIEASWLIVEAAEVLGDVALLNRARELAVVLARSVYEQGLDTDGSIFYEANSRGVLIDSKKHWWAQAEAVVGFFNAFQISQDSRFLAASLHVWDYIEAKVVDREHGEWHAKLSPEGIPLLPTEDTDVCLAGPWKCPYHNSRSCFEMLNRLCV